MKSLDYTHKNLSCTVYLNTILCKCFIITSILLNSFKIDSKSIRNVHASDNTVVRCLWRTLENKEGKWPSDLYCRVTLLYPLLIFTSAFPLSFLYIELFCRIIGTIANIWFSILFLKWYYIISPFSVLL